MIYVCNIYNILSTDQRFFPAAVDQREQDRVHKGGHLRQPDFVEPSVSLHSYSINHLHHRCCLHDYNSTGFDPLE